MNLLWYFKRDVPSLPQGEDQEVRRATVGSVVMPETILPYCIAARNVSLAPTGTSE
jgi:hypothetical protein